jgi:hypothetical protein
MKNMDKGLTVPKWMLIVWPKTPQMPQNLSAQFVCPSPKVLNFNEKRLHWASVVRDFADPLKTWVHKVLWNRKGCATLKQKVTMRTPKLHQSAAKECPLRLTTSGAIYSTVPQKE